MRWVFWIPGGLPRGAKRATAATRYPFQSFCLCLFGLEAKRISTAIAGRCQHLDQLFTQNGALNRCAKPAILRRLARVFLWCQVFRPDANVRFVSLEPFFLSNQLLLFELFCCQCWHVNLICKFGVKAVSNIKIDPSLNKYQITEEKWQTKTFQN